MKRSFVSLCFAAAAASAGAAQPAPPAESILACTALADASARLACFDRELAPFVRQPPQPVSPPAASLPAASPPVAEVVAPAASPAPAPPAPPPSATFGQEQMKREDRPVAAPEPATLQARIVSHRSGGQGTYLVTLDNGQVWRHETPSRVEYFKVDAQVTISRAAMGSYRMSLDGGHSSTWVRVRRVR